MMSDSVLRRIVVPWMHINEWRQVYEDVYSNNIKLMRRGLERMSVWKARTNQLPAGVDCTIGLLEVYLLDQEIKKQQVNNEASSYTENGLQLMCTTAVTRFLNHVSENVREVGITYYEVAKKLQVPSWLVDLRHTGSHGAVLPVLSVLRMAVEFGLGWLQENYWKRAANMTGWIVSNSNVVFDDKSIGQTLDCWQALKMYQIHGISLFDEIPDDGLRTYIAKVLRDQIDENNPQINSKKLVTVAKCIKRLERRLFTRIGKHCKIKGESIEEKMTAMFLESESFIPPVHYIALEEGKEVSKTHIVNWISSFWKRVLIKLQEEYSMFPYMVHKLIVMLQVEECQHRQLVMALWIDLLCLSMLKSKKYFSSRNLELSRLLSEGIQETSNPLTKIKEFEKENPDLQYAFIADVSEGANSCSMADVKLAVLNPNKFTSLFLQSLLKVARPTIPRASKELLTELVSIYTKDTELNSTSTHKSICSVGDLYKESSSELEFLNAVSRSSWDYASENEWVTCPLGILPWQKEEPQDLSMSHITWELTKSVEENTGSVKYISKELVKTVDWPEMKRSVKILKQQQKKTKRLQRTKPRRRAGATNREIKTRREVV